MLVPHFSPRSDPSRRDEGDSMRPGFAPILALTLIVCAGPGLAPRAADAGSLAGYASTTSAARGDTIGFHVSSDYPSLTFRFYRQCPDPELLVDVVGLVPADV